ncbi:DEAH-box RNA-dependent ATPase prp2 [Maudiozyma exigua]|uniref:RNA helicase n=1 Tax=Maudiozyma exigua TaxID=34358 RepID=A0A9P6W7I1_MAUEX|nr:DEAH-box RNA-dependent ATPase prp2 [Kazachstania exigua]
MTDPDKISGVGMRRRKMSKLEESPIEPSVETATTISNQQLSKVDYNSKEEGRLLTTPQEPPRSRYNQNPLILNDQDIKIEQAQRPSRYNPNPLTEEQKYRILFKDLETLERKLKKYGWKGLSRKDQEELGLKRELVELYEINQRDKTNAFKIDQNNFAKEENDRKKSTFQKDDKRTRQQLWEEQQLGNSVTRSNTDEICLPESERYEYVFDKEAMIDFTDNTDDMLEDSNEEDASDEEDEEKKELLTQLQTEIDRIKTVTDSRKLLPVYAFRKELMEAVDKNQALIIVGETGSGKTTQLPQYLVEDGYTQGNKYQIAVTQPRRVAAMSVAARVSDEMNVVLGKEVGYSIRFDEKTTAGKTILKYMTDGMLVREFLADNELSKYSCIMIDEAHERTLATDVLLGLLKNIMKKRPELKLLISSATVNAKKFSAFFDNCPIFNVPGRRFPVDIHYTLQPEGNYINAAITTIFQIHTTQPLKGDILLFLTGQEEIENTREKIEEISSKLGSRIPQLLITPIYANLPQEQQANIFQKTPDKCRKVVLATNIAETSLTIDGIKYVIDPGFVKENSYVPSTGMTQLLTIPCSKASVDQIAGRAGRTGPGKCFRLFTKYSYENELEAMPRPEIVRTNLSNTVLLLLSLGVKDLLNFPFLDKPQISTLTKSLENLYVLGALNSRGQITDLGKMMCEFPCEPEFAKVLYSAATHAIAGGVLEQCLSIVSMLHETTSIFIGSKKEATARIVSEIDSDHMLYLKVYEDWKNSNYSRSWCQDHKIQYRTLLRVRNIRNQLNRTCIKLGISEKNLILMGENGVPENLIGSKVTKSFVSGFPLNIVQLKSGGYQTIGKSKGGLNVNIHPSSVIFQNQKEKGKKLDKFILYQQLMLTSKEFVRDCIPIPTGTWLVEMVPQIFSNLNNDK